MTKEEILDVPVVEKEKKVKPEVSEDSVLSTFTNSESVEEKNEVDIMNSVENANDVQTNDMAQTENNINEVEIKKENVESNVQAVEEINEVVETGKTVELADNIISNNATNNFSNNTNLPADLNPYVKMVKEKLMAFGKIAIGFFEKIGDFVENLFKKK